MNRLLSPLVAVLTTAAVLASAAPAHAGSATFKDRRGEVPRTQDITSYTVINSAAVGVRTHHRNLTRKAVDMQVWFDLPGTSAAWDFLAYASLDGTFKQLYAPGFSAVGCSGIKVGRSTAKDWAQLTVPRSCLGLAAGAKVRARVRVQNDASGRTGDTAPSTNGYSRWVG